MPVSSRTAYRSNRAPATSLNARVILPRWERPTSRLPAGEGLRRDNNGEEEVNFFAAAYALLGGLKEPSEICACFR
jgi:hypothetical protein